MSATQHTPGPWIVHNNIGRKGELGIIAAAAPCVIAVMGNAKEWPVEAKANATLIAAAPDLAEALQDAVAWWHSVPRHFNESEPAWLTSARATLAKAGVTP